MERITRIVIFSVTCVVLLAAVSLAQPKVNLGIKGGMNLATMTGDATADIDTKTRTGLTFGAIAEIETAPNLIIKSEVNYCEKGVEKQDDNASEKVKLTYIQIPVLFKYKFPVQGKVIPSLYAGPAIAINMSGKDDIAGYGPDFDGEYDIANVKSTDLSAVLGGGVSFPMGKMLAFLDFRYDKSFGTAFDDVSSLPDDESGEIAFVVWDPVSGPTTEAEDLVNSGFSFSLGVIFPIGK